MANQEHPNILRQGVKSWNKWRRKYPEIRPDLIESNLHGADLSGVTLIPEDLRGAHLSRAKQEATRTCKQRREEDE